MEGDEGATPSATVEQRKAWEQAPLRLRDGVEFVRHEEREEQQREEHRGSSDHAETLCVAS